MTRDELVADLAGELADTDYSAAIQTGYVGLAERILDRLEELGWRQVSEPVARSVDGRAVVDWPETAGPDAYALISRALLADLMSNDPAVIEGDEGLPLDQQIDRQWSRRYRADVEAWARERAELQATIKALRIECGWSPE